MSGDDLAGDVEELRELVADLDNEAWADRQALEDIRADVADVRDEVRQVRAQQGRGQQRAEGPPQVGRPRTGRRARKEASAGASPAQATAANLGGLGPTPGLAWMAHPFKLRYSRRVYHWRNRFRRRLVGFVLVLIASGIAGIIWGDGSPWAPLRRPACGPGALTTATQDAAATESIAVRAGRPAGWLFHKITEDPPTPRETRDAAEKAGRALVVTVLAFESTATGQRDSTVVTRANAAYRSQKAAEAQNAAAACTGGSGSTLCPGQDPPTRTVGLTNPAGLGLDAEQAAIAGTIIATGRARGIPTQGQVVALAAALQESGLRNLNYGDRDSLGVFQQRAGWGSATERTNVAVAAGKFYDAIVRVPGWQAMPVTQAAQAVQGSAYPGAYARWEGQARALTGSRSAQLTSTAANVSGGMTCAVYPTTKGAGPGPWGGYSNGRIPVSALAHPASAPNALFRPDAAAAFDRLSAAYQARFGVPLPVTDSYRDYASQVRTKAAKPGLAATPGTSDHGWGLAADLGGGVQRFGTPQYQWMKANEGRFGWTHEAWAEPGGSRPEPWHHTYIGATQPNA